MLRSGLGEVEGAAILRDEGAIALGKEIAHVDQRFYAVGGACGNVWAASHRS